MKNKKQGLNRLTESAINIIKKASDIAQQNGFTKLEPIHIFYAIISEKNSINIEVLSRVGIDIESTVNSIKSLIENKKNTQNKSYNKNKDIEFSNQTKELVNESFKIASDLGHIYVGSEHLLLALFKIPNIDFLNSIKDIGIDYDLIKNNILNIGNYAALNDALKINNDEDEYDEGDERSDDLPQFCRDLNEMAIEGKFLEISGRDDEIQRLIHILSRKTKNNPILVGEAGVGKTAIVEGFVNLIVNKQVPPSFLDKKVWSIDIGGILAGSRLRGDVEERINSVINAAIEDGKVILFIDEIHMIVGAGSSGMKDSLDIANLLKPYLTNYNLSIIGATTLDEYNKYFESDSALNRRFQAIRVNELSPEATKKVIYTIRKDFEKFHNVKIPNEVINAAVELTNKFIKNRYLPDKAIDVIDEACAAVKIGREMKIQPSVSALARKLIEVQNLKHKFLSESNYEKATELKNKEKKLLDSIQNILDGVNKKSNNSKSNVVTVDMIKNVIYEWTKVPIVLNDIYTKNFKDFYTNLKKHIIGQDIVLQRVSKAIQKAHLGLNGRSRPLASFLFLGPSGVGKTETAKAIAYEIFGSHKFLYQINMSEFMEQHSVSKLIGAPPGYVGYQEGGFLSTFVKNNPYSVILFDELEKAHKDVINILLQILDEGELTDGKGSKIDFKNTIIVITSNIGAEIITRDSKLGFNVIANEKDIENAFKNIRSEVMEELKLKVRPELLNRIDIIEVFRGLNKQDSYEISKLLIDELKVRYIESHIYLDIDEKIIKYINDKGYSTEYGVRNIKRIINDELESKIVDTLLNYEFSKKNKQNILSFKVILENDELINVYNINHDNI